MMQNLTIFTNESMVGHRNMPDHPECPARLKNILEMIKNYFPDTPVENAYPASEELILLAHPQSHLDFILDKTPFEGWSMIDSDTGMTPHSYDAALLSVGAAAQATQAVMDGETQTAFALARPPGHHAEHDTAMGFCFFNNAFIAAKHSGVKTLIIDFDVHHGNGTEDLVKRHVEQGHNNIAYASTHQGFGFWPNTGNENSTNICNCPLQSGARSGDFRQVVTEKIIPFAKSFKPELIIFSAGFDGHESDPLGEINLIHEDFAWIVETVKSICPRIVSILEGGYNLETLPVSAKHHLKALACG